MSKGLRLATLHSHAVDYPKSGIPARMSKTLVPRIWPHFMERKQKKSYKSDRILGQLYDMVEREDFVPQVVTTFDHRILEAFNLESDMLEKARNIKAEYDASMKRIMAHHDIKTEFEVWSAFVMNHNREKKDYTFAEELGVLSQSIKDKFHKLCIEAAGGRQFDKLGRFVAAMYTVTADEFESFQMRAKESPVTNDQLPFISFPWIFDRELGRIATGHALGKDVIAIQGKRQRLHGKAPLATDSTDGEVHLSKGVLPSGELLKLFDDESPNAVGEDANAHDLDGDDMVSVDLDRQRGDNHESEDGSRTPASLLYEPSEHGLTSSQTVKPALLENGLIEAMDDLLVFDEEAPKETKNEEPLAEDEDLLMSDNDSPKILKEDPFREIQNLLRPDMRTKSHKEEPEMRMPTSVKQKQKPILNLLDDEARSASSCEKSPTLESYSSTSGISSPQISTPVSSVVSHITVRQEDVGGETVILANYGPSLLGRLRSLMDETSL
jgi:RNA dependent RNA polymerase